MKSIEERAEAFGKREIRHSNGILWEVGYREGSKVGYHFGATEQKAIDVDRVCADNVITDIGKVMLDPTISCKTKAELVRVILTKAMEE